MIRNLIKSGRKKEKEKEALRNKSDFEQLIMINDVNM